MLPAGYEKPYPKTQIFPGKKRNGNVGLAQCKQQNAPRQVPKKKSSLDWKNNDN